MNDPNQYDQNIFAQQAMIEQQNQPADREKPRANLYNVIKRLRESNVRNVYKAIIVTPMFLNILGCLLSSCPCC